jgi:hypothetical protein
MSELAVQSGGTARCVSFRTARSANAEDIKLPAASQIARQPGDLRVSYRRLIRRVVGLAGCARQET